MKPRYLFLIPLLVLAELHALSWIVELLRQPSDTAVIAGVILTCADIAGNYFLINYLITKTKKRK